MAVTRIAWKIQRKSFLKWQLLRNNKFVAGRQKRFVIMLYADANRHAQLTENVKETLSQSEARMSGSLPKIIFNEFQFYIKVHRDFCQMFESNFRSYIY